MRGSVREHRRLLFGAVVLALVWAVAILVFDPRNGLLDTFLHLGPTVLGLGLYLGLVGWRPAGPAAFLVARRRSAFVAPVNRRRTAELAALILLLAGQAALWIDRLREPGANGLDFALSALFVLAVAALLAHAWLAPPALELRPEGVRIPRGLQPITVRWESLQPGTPWAPRLRTQRLDLVGRVRTYRVPIDVLDIHPWFLADAIRYYIAHPEHRASIGRAAEHERLCRRLRDGGAPPALPAPPQRRALPAGPRPPGPRTAPDDERGYSRTRA
jgi:hypothetical protein